MTEMDRNVRTLIVCFSIALMVMIPLRFVEAGQMAVAEQRRALRNQGSVAGVEYTAEEEEVADEGLNAAHLEAPYDEIDGVNLGKEVAVDCVLEEQAGALIESITGGLVEGEYSEEEVELILDMVEDIEARVCQ